MKTFWTITSNPLAILQLAKNDGLGSIRIPEIDTCSHHHQNMLKNSSHIVGGSALFYGDVGPSSRLISFIS